MEGKPSNNQPGANHHQGPQGMDQHAGMHHYPANMMPPMGTPLGVPPQGLFMPPPVGGVQPNPYMMYPHQGMPPGGVPPGQAPGMMPPHMFAPKFDEEYEKNMQELDAKLKKIKQEIENMPRNDLEKFKDQKLPLARIKKIMKSDEDVRMISAEAPILFAKACEMFIVEMTHKAYYYASKNGRKTLQRNDIAAAITDTEIYDFLLDIMPRDEMINSNKDKQLSQYQLQLLDDVAKIQKMQTTQQKDQYLKNQQALIVEGGVNPENGQIIAPASIVSGDAIEEVKEGKKGSAKKQ